MKKTLLVIGDLYMDDIKKAPSINKFLRYGRSFFKRGIQFEFITWDDVLLGRLPGVRTKKLTVMLFFPYAFWNSSVERYDLDNRIYGDGNFGRDFKRLFLKAERIIEGTYRDKDLTYVNSPASCVLDRDKLATARLLRKNGISVPRIYNVKSIGRLNRILEKTEALYIKPVFGSMGKGISVVTRKELFTNFIFRQNKIISRPYDYNWKFVKISGNRRNSFLKILMERGFLFEEAIKLPVAGRRQFDIRTHVIFDKISYLFARSTPEKKLVTNWSQGGRMEGKGFLRRFVPAKKLEEIRKISRKSARIAGLKYAGIDVLIDEDLEKIYVLELHSFPGFVRRFNLMKALAEEIH